MDPAFRRLSSSKGKDIIEQSLAVMHTLAVDAEAIDKLVKHDVVRVLNQLVGPPVHLPHPHPLPPPPSSARRW
jgi:hypothetical protein